MNNQIFYVQIDGNSHVSQITHDNHANDDGWYMVIVDLQHLSAFQNNYNEVKCEPNGNTGVLVYPEGFAADAAITNDNKGIIQNLQDQINTNKNNILLNAKNIAPVSSMVVTKWWNNFNIAKLSVVKGHKYQVNFDVTRSQTEMFFGVDNQSANNYYSSGFYKQGQHAQYSFIANSNKTVPIGIGEQNDSNGCAIDNLSIYQFQN